MKPARVRNEWVDAYVESGKIVDEVPKHLIDAVIERAELRKPKEEKKDSVKNDVSIR